MLDKAMSDFGEREPVASYDHIVRLLASQALGADVGIAHAPLLRVSSGHILRQM
jgi:hypothetical protein